MFNCRVERIIIYMYVFLTYLEIPCEISKLDLFLCCHEISLRILHHLHFAVVATCAAVVVLSAVGGSIALIYIKIKSQM